MSRTVINTYLSLPGTTGNYVTTPNAAAIQLSTTLTIDAKVAPTTWTPAAAMAFFGKWGGGAGLNGYLFRLTSVGALIFTASADGSASTLSTTSSANTGFGGGAIKWVRVTFTGNSATGLRFWTSADGATWSQLGTSFSTTTLTSIFNASAVGSIGAYQPTGNTGQLAGNIYEVLVYNTDLGSGAGTAILDANFTLQNPDTTSFAESSANAATMTVNVSGTPQAVITRAAVNNNYQGVSVADNGNAVMSVSEKIR